MPAASDPSPSSQAPPWPPGAATGVGSLPGDDITAAIRLVLDELPDLPHLPELPARGPGADLIGRAAALLVDLHADLQPSGWRLVPRPGADERRALDLLARDLDALGEAADGWAGSLKVQVAGPLTLAAGLELARGEAALADHGAVRDIAAALAEGVAGLVAEVARRLPHARLLLQLDEPSAGAVLRGQVPTASGFGTLRPVPEPTARELLGGVVAAAEAPGAWPLLHSCAGAPPVATFVAAGARGVSFDAALVDAAAIDALGSAVEAGTTLFVGVLPALGPGVPPPVREPAGAARRLWHALGFPAERLPELVVVTPACGLAGASLGWARTAYRLCRQVGRALAEAPEEERGR